MLNKFCLTLTSSTAMRPYQKNIVRRNIRNKTPLKYLDGELVMDMISEAGYIPGFDPKEKFFKFYEKIEDYRFGLHIEGYSLGA